MRISAISSNNNNNRQKFGEVKIQPSAYRRILTSMNLHNSGVGDFNLISSAFNVKLNNDVLNNMIKDAKDLPDVHIRTVSPNNSNSPLIARVGDEFIYEKFFEPSIGTLCRAIDKAKNSLKN